MKLIVMIGNIGTGKSTKARELLNDKTIIVSMDSIIKMCEGGEYRYNVKKAEYYRELETVAISDGLFKGMNVIVDRTNPNQSKRYPFIEIGQNWSADIVAYDFGSGSVETLKRRQADPWGIPASQWAEVHKLFKKNYERPMKDEGFDEIINCRKK